MGNLAWNMVKAESSLGVEIPVYHWDHFLSFFFFFSPDQLRVRSGLPVLAHHCLWFSRWQLGIFALKTKQTGDSDPVLKGLSSPLLRIFGMWLFPSSTQYFESLKIQMAWFHLLEEGRNVWAAQVTGLVFRGWRERWGVFVSRLHWRSKDKRNKKLLHGSLPPIWCVFKITDRKGDKKRVGKRKSRPEKR